MLWFSSLPSFDTTTQQISFFYARPHHDKQNIHSDSQTICPTRRRNDGPMHKFKGKEQIKLVLDMSNDGPTFKMLESLMAATAGPGKSGKAGGYEALNKLLSSGIPGMEGLFSGDGKDNFSARYSKGSFIRNNHSGWKWKQIQ